MILGIPAPSSTNDRRVKASWRNLRWRPNESTGEILNIGVMVTEADGTSHVKLIDTFDRIKCLYNAHVADDAKFLVRVVREAILAGAQLPSSNVCLSEPKYASGENISAILEQLFRATVPLGVPRSERRAVSEENMRATDTPTVRREVLDALRRIGGLNADRIITSERTLQVVEDGIVHHLDIPLQHPQALGTIVSARYAQPKDNELNILRADSDLQIARKVYRRDRLYMYVVRHERDENADRTDELLREFIWKFSKVGIAMKTYTHPELVAADILEDMPVSSR